MYIADIQFKWNEHISAQIEENKNKNLRNEDQGEMLTLKKIESLLEIIRVRYRQKFDDKLFAFEKDLEEIGFELEDDDNRNFEIPNMDELIEWDKDIKRQREKWIYFHAWLQKQDANHIGDA